MKKFNKMSETKMSRTNGGIATVVISLVAAFAALGTPAAIAGAQSKA